MILKEHLKRKTLLVEEYLSDCLDAFDKLGIPPGLKDAMNYSLLAGGKRFRPALCLSAAGLFGLDERQILPFAAGIEFIHTYSLIHDDLPAMDDDDMRRGRPSNHKQFDEATAILAGDALLTDAFVFMAQVAEPCTLPPTPGIPARNVLKALQAVAYAAGSCHMVGGQYLDMRYTARGNVTLEQLARMQAGKTGAMISAACASGALLAGASQGDCEKLASYGRCLGRAFQIVDDILDETGNAEEMGKPTGSDAAKGKTTYPSLVGLEKSRTLAAEAGKAALSALEDLHLGGGFMTGQVRNELAFLRELVDYQLQRGA